MIERINARKRERLSAFLIQDDNGRLLSTLALRGRFEKARTAAGVAFQFRDIRAKTASDTNDLGHSQALLGHKTRDMTELLRAAPHRAAREAAQVSPQAHKRRGLRAKPQIGPKGRSRARGTRAGVNLYSQRQRCEQNAKARVRNPSGRAPERCPCHEKPITGANNQGIDNGKNGQICRTQSRVVERPRKVKTLWGRMGVGGASGIRTPDLRIMIPSL